MLKKRMFLKGKKDEYPNIISYWKHQNNVNDSVGNNDGIASNLSYISSLVNLGGDYNGSNTIVSIPDNDNLSFGNGVIDSPFSISFILKRNSDQSGSGIIIEKTQAENSSFEYLIYINRNLGFLAIRLFSGGSNSDWIEKRTTIPPLNSTYRYFITYSGNSNLSGINLYRNTVIQSTTDLSLGNYVAMSNTNASLNFGGRTNNSLYIDAVIDEVIIWSEEVTQATVTEVHTKQANGEELL